MKLSAAHCDTFNWTVLRVKFGLTSYEELPPTLQQHHNYTTLRSHLSWPLQLYSVSTVYWVVTSQDQANTTTPPCHVATVMYSTHLTCNDKHCCVYIPLSWDLTVNRSRTTIPDKLSSLYVVQMWYYLSSDRNSIATRPIGGRQIFIIGQPNLNPEYYLIKQMGGRKLHHCWPLISLFH